MQESRAWARPAQSSSWLAHHQSGRDIELRILNSGFVRFLLLKADGVKGAVSSFTLSGHDEFSRIQSTETQMQSFIKRNADVPIFLLTIYM